LRFEAIFARGQTYNNHFSHKVAVKNAAVVRHNWQFDVAPSCVLLPTLSAASSTRAKSPNFHLENGHPIRYSDRMSTYCAIDATRRHPRGEPRSPSPANPPLTAAPIRFLPTSQPAHSHRPLTSVSPIPPRSPSVAPGGVGELGELDARPAAPHDPAHVVTARGQLVVAPRVVQMNRRDQSASLQVHWHKQLQNSVAKSEFRDTWPAATQFAPLVTANWHVAETDFTRVGQQMRLATLAAMANMAESQKPALFHPRRRSESKNRREIPSRPTIRLEYPALRIGGVDRVSLQVFEVDELQRRDVRRGQHDRGAMSASRASFHRSTQRHQRSPATKPGNWYIGFGVLRSLPRDFEKARKSSFTSTQTKWSPMSSGPVRQQPSR
jgi:hypothetical protein